MTETVTDGLPEPSSTDLPASTAIPSEAAAAPVQPTVRSRVTSLAFWTGFGLDLLLVALIVIGVYFRFSWMNWNENTDLHPDEYGLTSNLTFLSIPKSLGDYFNTRISPLSPYDKYDLNGLKIANGPNNRFPYGQLPLTIIRLAAELTDNTGYIELRLLGRQLSALCDVLALLLTYLIGLRLYNHRVGLIGAALSALAVMQIQQSHFMTADNFGVLFGVVAMYCAVEVSLKGKWWWYALFGVFVGMAVASRINLALLAGMIIVAAVVANAHLLLYERDDSKFSRGLGRVIGLLILSGVCAALTFRVVQPMSFRADTGETSILTVTPNPDWIASVQSASAQNNGEGAGPPGEQWTNRPAIIFPLINIILWGMGVPLGLAAWAGFAWVAWRVLRGKDWPQHLLMLVWVGGYFGYMGTRWVKSIRYFLPIYPFLALFAAWLIVELWNLGQRKEIKELTEQKEISFNSPPHSGVSFISKVSSILLGAVVLFGTLTWAYGFTSIYRTENTRVQASRWIYQNIPAPFNLRLETESGSQTEPIPFTSGLQVSDQFPIPVPFTAHVSGKVNQLSLGYVRNVVGVVQPITLNVVLANDPNGLQPIAQTTLNVIPTGSDYRGTPVSASFGPAELIEGTTYYLLVTAPKGGPVYISGSTVANEDWDEGLPLRIEGRDGFGGLYEGETMRVRAGDNEDKRIMFATVLAQTDYIILPSQRGLWSTSRLPATYPMTVEYYRALFDGRLGFDLVKTFTSPIVIGPLRISDVGGSWAWNEDPKLPLFNDSSLAAEEAFSVYDHAPVWIFQKRADFNIDQAMAVLYSIDLNKVVVLGPRETTAAPTLLMLPEDRLQEQQSGGTWADMFNREWPLNKYQPLGVIVWWLTCVVLGWVAFPIVFVALRGLPDRGYAIARNFALLFIAWTSWLLGSFQLLPFSQLTLWLMAALMLVISAFLAWRRRAELSEWLRRNGRYMLIVEGLGIAFFVFFLLIRWGNGDLWHGSYGGEKPMDFSYFNAVLKSTSFPPYDPWFEGGYLNYYYFGFVVVATLTKMLAIVPAFAYNLILPMLFSLVAMGGFCVAYNLVTGGQRLASDSLPNKLSLQRIVANPYIAGIAAACLFVVLGNLGQWNTIMQAFARAARDIAPLTPIPFINDWQRIFVGFWRIYIQHYPVAVGTGEWYWNATRVIPDPSVQPITEFPFFTFLYADLHAHMIVLTTTTMALAWCLSYIFTATEKRRWLETIVMLVMGGIVFGAIQPSNLSDYQTYWALGCVAIAYAELRRRREFDLEYGKQVIIWCGLLIGLAIVFFQPYTHWRGEGYGSVNLWKGDKTPLDSYWTIHGLFLFIFFIYLLSETRRWMQRTKFDDIKDYIGPAIFLVVAFALIVFGLWWLGYNIVVIAFPLLLWTGLLMIQKEAEPERRAVLGLMGLGLVLTVVVEVIVAKGDIGRMNTVFKFYLQVWTFFSIAGGAAIAWLWAQLPEWKPLNRGVWQLGLTALVTVAAMYTVLATSAKVQDRMAPSAPRTLDGMLYMDYAQYADRGVTFDLKWDYEAIIWMQENVKGSPVIVEVHPTEYKWGSRYTINTGLPGVLGWSNHQRQQRNLVPGSLIDARIQDIDQFYLSYSETDAMQFLKEYNVTYVIVGEYEKVYYPQQSLAKFDQMVDKGLLTIAYQNQGTKIYQVVKK